jgi:uncharacterized repeat protein (TIGR01451 family)
MLFLVVAVALIGTRAAAQDFSADLSVSFVGTPAAISLGQYFKVTVSVLNPSVPAANVVVSNVLPANAAFVP